MGWAEIQLGEGIDEVGWCELLCGIAPSTLGLGVRLDHQSGEVHLQPHTADQRYEVSAPSDMAGINEDGKLGVATA